MKTLRKIVIILIILTGNFSFIGAQDTIIKTDNEKIICKIKEISTNEIKYLLLNNGNEILLGIDKNDVSQVRLSNGTVMNFENSMYGAETLLKFAYFLLYMALPNCHTNEASDRAEV
jgi:hypothetical protein